MVHQFHELKSFLFFCISKHNLHNSEIVGSGYEIESSDTGKKLWICSSNISFNDFY